MAKKEVKENEEVENTAALNAEQENAVETPEVEETEEFEDEDDDTEEDASNDDASDESDEDIDSIISAAKANEEEFDWEKFESNQTNFSNNERQSLTEMYDKTLSSIAENEVVEGVIVSLTKREAVVNIGYKSDGVVNVNEFRYNPDLKPGDKVEVFVESQEDKSGQLILSHKKARALKSWDRVNQALEGSEIVKGFVKCRTKGGMIVDVFGIEAFLPGSQIDVKPIRDYDVYVGKTMEFKVVKINHEFKNVVVSHKALIEAELEVQKKEIISKLEKGQVLEGIVKNITTYGVFIDLGGVDGLIHITDLSWGRITHPEEIVKLDEKINVVILDFDDDKKRIALGLKQLTPHPWDTLDANLQVGDKVKGKVVVIADYGAFVEIATGIEGLIHVSEMSWSQHLRSAQEFLHVGDDVEAVVLTLDREERKMSLGMKQLKPDPWDTIDTKYTVGSKHKATVRNFTNFGVFVEIEEGVDGLVHISDLSWTKKIKHPAEFTAVSAPMEVVVLEVDKENRRLSLGHKQLEENPWDVFETIFSVDSIHEGTILEINDKNVTVALPYGVEAISILSHINKEDGTPAKVDEKLDFKVIEFSKDAKKIFISHTRTFEDAKKAADEADKKEKATSTKKAMKKVSDSIEKTTLGDVSALADLKADLKKAESNASTNSATDTSTGSTSSPTASSATGKVEKTEDKVESEPENASAGSATDASTSSATGKAEKTEDKPAETESKPEETDDQSEGEE